MRAKLQVGWKEISARRDLCHACLSCVAASCHECVFCVCQYSMTVNIFTAAFDLQLYSILLNGPPVLQSLFFMILSCTMPARCFLIPKEVFSCCTPVSLPLGFCFQKNLMFASSIRKICIKCIIKL